MIGPLWRETTGKRRLCPNDIELENPNGNANLTRYKCPDSKVHGANMGPIWGRQDPGGPHVGPMNFAIWVSKV